MSFVVSKLAWAVLQPGNPMVLALVAASILGVARRPGARVLSTGLLSAVTVLLLAVTLLPMGDWLLRPLEDRFGRPEPMPEQVDGIIVLGGMVDQVVAASRNVPALNAAAERLTEFAALARRYPDARLVVSGGSGLLGEQDLKEAPAMLLALEQMGLPSRRIVTEDRSRNTYENALFSRSLVEPGEGETWILVTSAYHMPRSVGVFRTLGWDVTPWPVDYRTIPSGGLREIDAAEALLRGQMATREWLGLAAYRWMDRTGILFPGP
ncbi:MAG TPA: YdcF family protein [Arenibaculum sp.]|nr:YdcF family protein [Arenibaculum sp.]